MAVARARRAGPPEWEYLPGGWPPSSSPGGWSDDSIARVQAARWPAFVASVEGTAPFGRSGEAAPDSPLDYATHNTVMSFGYVLGRAARLRTGLSMLDWGGGLGHYAVYARALLPDLALEYHCRELPALVAEGRKALPWGTFHERDATALDRRYDLVLASSSLHYSQDWRGTLAKLAAATAEYLYVTRQPFVTRAPSYVVVQRPHRHGYMTAYPGWFLNREEFLAAAASHGLRLCREFLIDERPPVVGAPEQADYRGFLFQVLPGQLPARVPEATQARRSGRAHVEDGR